MASSILFGLLLILMETNTNSGQCTEHWFDNGTQNVLLEFEFAWEMSETKHVHCFFNGNNKIGECYDLFGFKCPLVPWSTGVYSMSPNADLTVVNVTIKTFDSSLSGNYSCSKDSDTTTITKCVKTSDSTTLKRTRATTIAGWTPVCTAERVLAKIGAFFFIADFCLVILLTSRCGCNELCQIAFEAKKSYVPKIIACVAIGVGLLIIVVATLESNKRCEEEWTVLNSFFIAIGIMSDVLLITMCIAPIRDLLENSVKNLHYGLVLSGFKRYAAEDWNQLFQNQCAKYKKDGKPLIESFLLVIPNNCKLILPEDQFKQLKSSATRKFKEVTLELVEEVDYAGVHKLKIYKIQTEEKVYYVCAEVPTVLTVISSLSQTLRGMTIAGLVRQKFQLLYQHILDRNSWTHTVQLVTCNGNADVARALFEVAQTLATRHQTVTGFVENDVDPFAKSEICTKSCGSKCEGKICQLFYARPSKLTTNNEVDVIPGLAWDYVHNDLTKHLTTYLEKIRSICKKKFIIVWLKSCNTEKCLTDVAKKSDNKRLKKHQFPDAFVLQNLQPLNVFKLHSNGVNMFFGAEYCTPPMQCIKMNEEKRVVLTWYARAAQGPRFKVMFDEIMSRSSIKQLFKDINVSLIYFDDESDTPKKSLIDLLEEELKK